MACGLVVLVLTALAWWSDVTHVRWADRLAQEGSPPPATAATSPTGFVSGQRHYLGTMQRGDTYRWITHVREFMQDPLADEPYRGDALPEGRPQLLPAVYAGGLAALTALLQIATDLPAARAAERAAVWEPVLSHSLMLIGAAVFLARRFGAATAAVALLVLVFSPLVFSQYVPGSLNPSSWALLAATYALALHLPVPGQEAQPAGFSACAAIAAAVALWLDPFFGFSAVLISAGVGLVSGEATRRSALRWAVIGAALVLASWLLNRDPWNPSVSELRYIHPFYGLAWLGLAVVVTRIPSLRSPGSARVRATLEGVGGIALCTPLVLTLTREKQFGWLHPTAYSQRLASIDGSAVFENLLSWIRHARAQEVLLLLAPLLAAWLVVIVDAYRRRKAPVARERTYPLAVLLGLVTLLACLHVRWLVVATLLAAPLLAQAATARSITTRRGIGAAAVLLGLALAAWGQNLPDYLRPLRAPTTPSRADLEALVFRHFSRWLATQGAGHEQRVLAPPVLSDSLNFHGGARVLLSTAWESHPGHVAASRILSSPEATEAEAVIGSLGLTHVVITSWDPVLPLLVKRPLEADRDTLYERLQRWILPPYLRPLPYRLPSTPGFVSEKLAVFAVVPPQDEALALSRLAEYFLEVGRPEPAGEVAKALHQAYANDLNAVMARAQVAEAAGDTAGFQQALDRLADDVARGLHPMDADRRIVRATVLALGRRHDVARSELRECSTSLSEDVLRQLTPLQIFRLRRLLELYQLAFPSSALAELAAQLSADYRS